MKFRPRRLRPANPPVNILPLGDSALIVEVTDHADPPAPRRVNAVCARLEAAALPGVTELVPAAATVTLFYAPAELAEADDPFARLTAQVRQCLADLPADRALPEGRVVEIPVCYGGEYGPDLEAVARFTGLSAEEVIARHSGAEFQVLQLGFAPGFPYLSGLPAELAMPRRDSPRTSVPAGSVGIANNQSCVYPVVIPGGWNLLGRTPLKLFRPHENPPVLLRPGDRVRFSPITPAEFRQGEEEAP